MVCPVKIFLAGCESRKWILKSLYEDIPHCSHGGGDEDIKIYLAESPPWRSDGIYDPYIKEHRPYILESFYYVNEDTERLLPYYGDFLLDSGAFTFMQGNHDGEIKWDEYIERYSAFVVKNRIKSFFELDIDVVVGYEKVKEYRKLIEKKTGKQPIPVWHISRGMEDFQRMCDEYPRVAIGGIVSGEIKKDKYKIFPALIKEAHKKGAKIHGLGFTNLSMLNVCKFDSVDSTAWTTGNRYGFLYRFTGRTMEKIDCPRGSRIGKPKIAALNNYVEWIKYQKWADTHL